VKISLKHKKKARSSTTEFHQRSKISALHKSQKRSMQGLYRGAYQKLWAWASGIKANAQNLIILFG
jgi:hypothetical protein